jgi:hypothetical protein
MGFRFKVLRVNDLKDLIILDGLIDPEARIYVGSSGALSVDSSKRITITGVGSKCGDSDDPTYSLTIAPPDFPLSELEDAVIVGD